MLQRSDASASVPGVDRVLWLRVTLRGGVPCEGVVHGVRHRRPVEVEVSADIARRLVARGVPAVAVGVGG